MFPINNGKEAALFAATLEHLMRVVALELEGNAQAARDINFPAHIFHAASHAALCSLIAGLISHCAKDKDDVDSMLRFTLGAITSFVKVVKEDGTCKGDPEKVAEQALNEILRSRTSKEDKP